VFHPASSSQTSAPARPRTPPPAQIGIASNFTILYAGSLPITLSGATANYGVVYAPNSAVNISGSAPWYAAFVSKSYVSSGGSMFHYDLALNNSMLTMGSFVPVSFSWNKF
jgi:hypothetical protein